MDQTCPFRWVREKKLSSREAAELAERLSICGEGRGVSGVARRNFRRNLFGAQEFRWDIPFICTSESICPETFAMPVPNAEPMVVKRPKVKPRSRRLRIIFPQPPESHENGNKSPPRLSENAGKSRAEASPGATFLSTTAAAGGTLFAADVLEDAGLSERVADLGPSQGQARPARGV